MCVCVCVYLFFLWIIHFCTDLMMHVFVICGLMAKNGTNQYFLHGK